MPISLALETRHLDNMPVRMYTTRKKAFFGVERAHMQLEKLSRYSHVQMRVADCADTTTIVVLQHTVSTTVCVSILRSFTSCKILFPVFVLNGVVNTIVRLA